MKEKDITLLAKSKLLKDLLEDFRKFMIYYERDEIEALFTEYGKKSLDYVISEFSDIVENIE